MDLTIDPPSMDLTIDPQPGAQTEAWLAASTVSVPGKLLSDIIEVLEDVGCQFFACDGPTLEPRDMITCHRCEVLAKARVAAGRTAHDEYDSPTSAQRADPTPEPARQPITWDQIKVGQIIRYEHRNRTRRLAGRAPLIRRAQVRAVYPPAAGRRGGQISIAVLNNDNKVNARLGHTSIHLIDMVVGIESEPTTVDGAGTGGTS